MTKAIILGYAGQYVLAEILPDAFAVPVNEFFQFVSRNQGDVDFFIVGGAYSDIG
jgi:hypothetical protein